MNALTHAQFHHWLDIYSRASIENDPRASATLFAETAVYYESPFADPLVGRDAIFQYWANGARTLKDKASTCDILAVQAQRGIARWQSQFTMIDSGKRLALDCLFVVEFDATGLCQMFREWWDIREIQP